MRYKASRSFMEQDEKPGQSGGANISGGDVSAGEIVGRDKDTIGGDKVLRDKYVQIAPPPEIPAIHQLPAPPADFTGRADDLAELLKAVKTGGVTISGLQGLGGGGKTALALKLAEQLKADYPDAQFYLDLKVVSPKPLTPREAMAHVVRGYHPTAQLPEDEDQLVALYRSKLDGQRCLLLMDNARDEKQVQPLIPPPGCLMLVTSRLHFTLPGLAEKNLDKLQPGDAVTLLLRIAPRLGKEQNDKVAELARLCGYLPLALRAVGSALQEKKNLSLADYARQLEETGQSLLLTETDTSRQLSTEAALQSSYELLPERLQRRFRFLAVFPDTFDQAAAAAVWAMKEDEAQDRLSKLLAYSLIDFDETSRRYSLHDLVCLFADQRLTSEERMKAQKSHAGHYLQVLGDADELYLKGGESVDRGLALFDIEWGNIQAGQAWASAQAASDKEAAQACWRYPYAGAYCVALRQHPRGGKRWLETALSAARRLKQRGSEGTTLGNLGGVFQRLGEYRYAIESQEQALVIFREIGDRWKEGGALGTLGLAYESLGEYRRAIEYHEQHLKTAREIGDRRGEGNGQGNLGNAYFGLGEYHRAIEYYEQG